MKRRILIAIAVAAILACSVILAACGEEYNVTLDYGYDDKTETVTVGEGSVFVLPVAERTDYVFGGWKDANGQTVTAQQKITADVTYTAVWTQLPPPQTATVTFTVPEGETAPQAQTVTVGASATLPAAPEIDGEQFVGWVCDDVVYPEGASVTVGGAMTFAATYKTEITVRYVIPVTGVTAPSPAVKLGGDVFEVAAAPQAQGYLFRGWKLNGGEKLYQGGDYAVVSGEQMTFTAVYSKEVTITFSVNGGSEEITAYEGDSVAAPVPQGLSREQVFEGWAADGEPTEVVLAQGEMFTAPQENATYVAVISQAVRVSIYDENDALVDVQYVKVGGKPTLPAHKYPAYMGEWYNLYQGLEDYTASADDVAEGKEIRPIYAAEPNDYSIFEFFPDGENYKVAYKEYSAGMGDAEITDLVLPSKYQGKPVVGIYGTATAAGTTATNANSKKGGFALSSKLQRVYIPAGYTSLCVNAFNYDTKLTEVVFAEDISLGEIPIAAFGYCSSLGEIDIPESVTLINKNAFCNTALVNLTIPAKVSEIGEKAFNGCGKLAEVTFAESDVALTIGNYAFGMIKPTSSVPYESALTSFTFPARTVSIGQYVFQYCMSIEQLTFESPKPGSEPKALAISNNAFAAAAQTNTNAATQAYPFSSKLTSVTIPARTASIGDAAFANQIFLEEVKFDEGFGNATMGARAFFGLIALKSVNVFGVETISNGAFGVPGSSTGAYIKYYTKDSPATAVQPAEKNATALTNVTIGAGVQEISANAFLNQYKLAQVTFGADLTTLKGNSFYLSSGIVNTALTTLSFPQGLTDLGDGSVEAFRGSWHGLTSIMLDCPQLTTVVGLANGFAGDVELAITFKNIAGVCNISKSFNKTLQTKSITFENCDEGTFNFIGCFQGDWALSSGIKKGLSGISSVSLPKQCTVDKDCFSYAEGIDVSFAQGSKYTAANGAIYFTDDNGDKTLVKYLWKNVTFNDAEDVVGHVAIADEVLQGVKVIDQYAFYGIPATSLNIPASVETIGTYAFYGHKLTALTIPSTVKLVGSSSFNNGKALISVECNAATVETNAFAGCNELQSVTIGETNEKLAWTFVDWPEANGATKGFKLVEVIIKGATSKTFNSEDFSGGTGQNLRLAIQNGAHLKILIDAAALDSYQEVKWSEGSGSTAQEYGFDSIGSAFATETVTVTFGDSAPVTVIKGGWIPESKIPEGEWQIDTETDFDASAPITSDLTLTQKAAA